MAETFKIPNAPEPVSTGDEVWVVERDEVGYPMDFTGYMFLAKTGEAVLACSFINDMTEADETLEYLIQETEEDDLLGEIGVFRARDCYPTRDAAENALNDEKQNGGNTDA